MILTGFAANLCVVYTANDAYMRDFRIVVPSDCVASEVSAENEQALAHMRKFLKAGVRPSAEIDLEALVREPPPRSGAEEKRATSVGNRMDANGGRSAAGRGRRRKVRQASTRTPRQKAT